MFCVGEAVSYEREQQIVAPDDQATDGPRHGLRAGEVEVIDPLCDLFLSGLAGVLIDGKESGGLDHTQDLCEQRLTKPRHAEATAAFDQVRQPIFEEGILRGRRAGDEEGARRVKDGPSAASSAEEKQST
jgi:hypothetical protein